MQTQDWNSFGVPSHYIKNKFDITGIEPIIERVKSFLKGNVPGNSVHEAPAWCLFIHGDSGIGKTHLCCQALKFFVTNQKNISAQFLTCRKYFSTIQEYFGNAVDLGFMLEAIKDRDFLVLDDFGVDRGTDWQKEKLYELLEERYNRQKKTIISSNWGIEIVKQHYGDRLYRRVKEGIIIHQKTTHKSNKILENQQK